MPWDQFEQAGFHNIDICDRTTKRDLRLNVHEDLGLCGVVYGCLAGLADFTLCCRGLRAVYFGHNTTQETKSARRGCCGRVGGAPDDGLSIAV